MSKNREEMNRYRRKWEKNNSRRMKKYRKTADEKRRLEIVGAKKGRQRVNKMEPAEARRIFESTISYAQNKITHSGFMHLSAEKIVKLNLNNLKILGLRY